MNEPIPKPCKCGNTFVGPTHHFDIVSLKTVYHVTCLICGKQGEKFEVKKIPGQTIDLCVDIAAANSLGASYGVYMGMKRDQEVQQFYEKFGIRLKRRRRK